MYRSSCYQSRHSGLPNPKAKEAGNLQEALDVALLNYQNLIDDAVNREATVAQSLHEVTLNLHAQTQQNAALVQLNDELNAHARILTTERDDALKQKDVSIQ